MTAAVVRAAEQDQSLFKQRQQAENKSELQNPITEAPVLQIAAAAANPRAPCRKDDVLHVSPSSPRALAVTIVVPHSNITVLLLMR